MAAKKLQLYNAFIILSLLTAVHTTVYNVALSTAVGGTATAYSSNPFSIGYEVNWANDGVTTFCNSNNCPGPYY